MKDTMLCEQLLGLKSPWSVKGVDRGMARRQQDAIEHLGLDGKSAERGHSYASILTDTANPMVKQ